MSDESILVVVLLGGIAAMIAGLLWYLRGAEARLAAQREIEIPIESTWRAVLVILPCMVVGPVLVAVLARFVDPAHQHALAGTLTAIGIGCAGLLFGTVGFRRFRRIGVLRCTPTHLELELGTERRRIDLAQPFELDEADTFGPNDIRCQVVIVSQGNQQLGFSYGLRLGRSPHGDHHVDSYVKPLLSGQTRVVHDRLRARLQR